MGQAVSDAFDEGLLLVDISGPKWRGVEAKLVRPPTKGANGTYPVQRLPAREARLQGTAVCQLNRQKYW